LGALSFLERFIYIFDYNTIMASLELIIEILKEAYFTLGIQDQIPRKLLIQLIVKSTRRVDQGALTRLINALVESGIFSDVYGDGRTYEFTNFAYSLLGVSPHDRDTVIENQAKTEIKELLGDGNTGSEK
jgi:hypothetical protein